MRILGKSIRTGIYSRRQEHLDAAQNFITSLENSKSILVEVLPLSNFIRSDEEHQDRLQKNPKEKCHIPKKLLHKYRIRDLINIIGFLTLLVTGSDRAGRIGRRQYHGEFEFRYRWSFHRGQSCGHRHRLEIVFQIALILLSRSIALSIEDNPQS